MNRRTFLKQLPMVAALPFLPNLPELPATPLSLTEGEKAAKLATKELLAFVEKLGIEPTSEILELEEAENQLNLLGQQLEEIKLTSEWDFNSADVWERITGGASNFVNEGLDATDTAQRLEIGLRKLLEINELL